MSIERVTRSLLVVLGVLIGAHKEDIELYGWAIIKATGLRGPTVYRILDRLEDNGWLTSRWEEDAVEGRPRRRLYRLTPHGCAAGTALLHERRSQHFTLGWQGAR